MYANRLAAAALGLAVGLGAVALPAYAMPVDALSCQQLWVKRNAIYKVNGYCFKTTRARNYFGNAGCYIDEMDDVHMSKSEMQKVLLYKHWETVNGC
jgi:hypothetical protein